MLISWVVKLFSKPINHLIKNLEVLKEFDKNENSENIELLINSIIYTKYENSKVFIYGVGRSGYVGRAFAMRLMHLGFNVHFVGDTTCPAIGNNDLLIILSGSGETFSAVNILKRAKELKRDYDYKLKTISITCKKESSIKKLSDMHIHLNIRNDECFPMGTLFEDIAFIFLDVIVHLLMKRLNISESEMKKRHCNLQ